MSKENKEKPERITLKGNNISSLSYEDTVQKVVAIIKHNLGVYKPFLEKSEYDHFEKQTLDLYLNEEHEHFSKKDILSMFRQFGFKLIHKLESDEFDSGTAQMIFSLQKNLYTKKRPLQKIEYKRLDLKTGFICNNNCRFCVQADNKPTGNRTFEDIKKDLEDTSERCTGIVLTGGEVTIRKDFFEIVELAKNLGYKAIQVRTNGRMFSSLEFCKKAIASGVTEVAIAIHGYCEEQHDYLTRTPGSFRQTVQGIKNLKSLGVILLVNVVVVKQNYQDLPKIAEFLVKLDVDQFQLAFVHAVGNAWTNFEEVVPYMSKAAPYMHKGLQVGIDAGKTVMTEAMPLCLMKGYEKYISEKIIPETEVRGIAYQNTNDSTQQRKSYCKTKFPQCKQCKHDNICEGTWKEYPERRGYKEFQPCSANLLSEQS